MKLRILFFVIATALSGCGGGGTETTTSPGTTGQVTTTPTTGGNQNSGTNTGSGTSTGTSTNTGTDANVISNQSVTENEASVWLMQSSFGPTATDIAAVQSVGYEGWLEQQFALPANEHLALFDQTFPPEEVYQQHWVETWWMRSVYADDQLRQRVAFALSQIFVVSTTDDRLFNDPRGVASYYDVLLNGAFGNYRDLLENVTLHPIMGMYLSMLGNEKPDPDRNIRPDENYAREVMQLFSIGLVQLNHDGTVITDADGNPIPTYDQDDIKGFAHVFTGWKFAGATNWWEYDYNSTQAMTAYEDWHDSGEKALIGDVVLPAGQDARTDLDAALDLLFNHPNVGPFIGKQLIQRLVTSNPSPEYVARISAVFNDNGEGVRGDLQAVVRAILLDDEARDASLRTTGKLRMPLLQLAHLYRVFENRARDGGFGHEFIQYDLGISPLGSPSVFNFYRPDYSLPGSIRDGQLLSPEFQTASENNITLYINTVYHSVMFNSLRGDEIVEDNAGIVDFAYLSTLADDHDALLDYLNIVLLGGNMDDIMRSALNEALDNMSQGQPQWMKLANVVYLVAISPQFAVQL